MHPTSGLSELLGSKASGFPTNLFCHPGCASGFSEACLGQQGLGKTYEPKRSKVPIIIIKCEVSICMKDYHNDLGKYPP